MRSALAGRRTEGPYRPLERVVRPPLNSAVHSKYHHVIDKGPAIFFNQDHLSQIVSWCLRESLLPDEHDGMRPPEDSQQLPTPKEALFPLVGITDLLKSFRCNLRLCTVSKIANVALAIDRCGGVHEFVHNGRCNRQDFTVRLARKDH